MAQLREVLSKNGLENVRTYIASGNVLVDTSLSAKKLEDLIHDLIKQYIGPDIKVVVRTVSELQKLLNGNPFGDGYDGSRVFYVSFSENPSAKNIQMVLKDDFGENKLSFGQHGAYMYIPGNAARSKLNNNYLEKKLEVSATTRNFNTLNKLIELGNQ